MGRASPHWSGHTSAIEIVEHEFLHESLAHSAGELAGLGAAVRGCNYRTAPHSLGAVSKSNRRGTEKNPSSAHTSRQREGSLVTAGLKKINLDSYGNENIKAES